jgi:hypothetical protein
MEIFTRQYHLTCPSQKQKPWWSDCLLIQIMQRISHYGVRELVSFCISTVPLSFGNSKRQGTIETSVFGAELVAMKTGIEA